MNSFQLTASPFAQSSERPDVTVAHGQLPYDATRSALSTTDLSPARNKLVLLKPNAGRVASPGDGITTHPEVVAAAIDAFLDAGATVIVGDSPITGVKSTEALEAAGIAEVARARGCRLVDMDARPYVGVDLPEGQAIREIRVCAEVHEVDLVVSIPVMKIHMHTGVTLAVKNMKGCLWRRSKIDLHMLPVIKDGGVKSLDIAIADMSCALRPHLSIIDGTVGMEGLGPSAGKPKALGAVVVGADAFAADAVACGLMGIRAEDVPHLNIGAERGYGVIDLQQIHVSPDNWKDFIDPFEKAPESLSIQFPDIAILDRQSCSACQSTLLLFLQRHGGELWEYFPKDHPITIAIGKGHESVPPGTICVGNCTASHKETGIFVPGCPPVGSAILKTVKSQHKPETRQN